ncbi:hypothetical protein [Glycomyces paridis]|uniref:DUF2569 domain-containing protein n=1 Tax=Glycomyces paridis TaxID=2126555 RepID=A0A4S8PJ25_9ACTN|nr:hypothetical protein [Glycomyces paridis]THV28304.1 hypothetical protein E9998_11860 [Glycomyces paridis]
MPVPSPTPSRPGTVTAAQMLVWFQVLSLFCCGFAPVYMWQPAFVVVALSALPIGPAFWLLLLALGIGSVVYAVITVSHLGNGDRRGRTAITAGLIVIAALGLTPVFCSPADGDAPIRTLITAAPSILCQAIAWVCIHSASAERWFLETEAFKQTPPDPEPNPETETPE